MSHPPALLLRSALTAIVLTASASAWADSAKLTITGKVLPGTCTLVTAPITLRNMQTGTFQEGDNAEEPGVLQFEDCIGVTRATLTFDGAAADGDDTRWKNTAGVANAAKDVSISLLKGTSGTSNIKKGDQEPLVVSGNVAQYLLRAAYHVAAGTQPKAGDVLAEITVTASYE